MILQLIFAINMDQFKEGMLHGIGGTIISHCLYPHICEGDRVCLPQEYDLRFHVAFPPFRFISLGAIDILFSGEYTCSYGLGAFAGTMFSELIAMSQYYPASTS